MVALLQSIAKLDRAISQPLIAMDKLPISIVLYPCAAFFHPKLIWLAYTLVYLASGYDAHATVVYLLGTGVCLLTTFLLKRYTRRARPDLNDKVKKAQHFRKKEKNHSFPSGDAIQSALFVAYLHFLGVPLQFLIPFHVGVCLGRVYFMCHWLLDTVAATVLGVGVGLAMNELRLRQLLKPEVELLFGGLATGQL